MQTKTKVKSQTSTEAGWQQNVQSVCITGSAHNYSSADEHKGWPAGERPECVHYWKCTQLLQLITILL